MGGVCCSDDNNEEAIRENLVKFGSVDKGVIKSEDGEESRSSISRKSIPGPERELVQSEKRYFKLLKTLQNEFLVPLFNRGILPESKQKIFTHELGMIYKFHETFNEDLQNSQDIPGLFIAQADFFKIYVHYVENYTLILDCLTEFRENSRFVEFTKALNEKNLHFESLLIAPIQRVPRYELLLKEMIKVSKKTGTDYEKLTKALDKVHGVAEKLNERKREFERLARMSYIASRIYGLPDTVGTLYHPHRKFIDEQEMKRRSKYDDSKLQRCLTLLFSDILMTTDLSYKFKRLVQLSKVSSTEVAPSFNGLIFRIESDKDLYLFCQDLETAEEWKEKVLMTRDRFLAQRNSRLSVLTTHRSSDMRSFKCSEAISEDLPQGKSSTSSKVDGKILPIFPISSSGFSNHRVSQIRNTKGHPLPNIKHSVQTISNLQEPTATIAESYDDYDI